MREYSFIHPDPTLQNNLMAFGFECNPGWYPLIIECFDKLQDIINEHPEYKEFEILQVKEKWGELTIYTNYYWKELEDILDEYAKKSLSVCEMCGTEELVLTRIIHGWYSTLCEDCSNKL